MDADNVESSNLHRQIIHTEGRAGINKAESAAHACAQLNSLVPCEVSTPQTLNP
jgi:molybdopterin/thiamine biosynthesis adenylyltransferase